MINIENTRAWGFQGAIRGMRMPYESFDKSDSTLTRAFEHTIEENYDNINYPVIFTSFLMGKNDLALCKKLIKAGSEHRKFLRMIHVQADILAPRYWWAEMDKYKYVEANSSSTMHLITKRHLTEDDFSVDPWKSEIDSRWLANIIDYYLNPSIDAYNNLKNDKDRREYYFRKIKQLLPESYNQLRTIDTNYEALLSIYHQRKNHRLSEWSGLNGFCRWIKSLPYMGEFLEAVNE